MWPLPFLQVAGDMGPQTLCAMRAAIDNGNDANQRRVGVLAAIADTHGYD